MNSTQVVFQQMAENGLNLQKKLHELAKSPYKTKQLAPFGIEKAAKLAGCTSNHIRNLESRGEISAPQRESGSDDGLARRLYTLADVNKIREVTGRLPARPEGTSCLKVVFSNLKGGVGKSTSSVHFAQYCAREGWRVCLLDMDPQASSTSVFGYVPDLDLEDSDTVMNALLENPEDIQRVVRKTYWDQLDLIPAQLDLQNVDYLLPSDKNGPLGAIGLRLRQALAYLEPHYDLVVIDTPPALGMLSINSILSADYLITPMTPFMYDIASSVNYFRIIEDLSNQVGNIGIKRLSILITRHDGSHDSNAAARMIAGAYGEFVLHHHMMQTAEMQKSSSDMLTVYEQTTPRGSRETYRRALMLLDSVNKEILDNCVELWNAQALSTTQPMVASR